MNSNSFLSVSHFRVRFAPSPTGLLHVGGARTALFNWLFARHFKGVFILRIEDSDQKRSRPELVDEILNELNWLGLNWDEGPFFQSRRFEIYRRHALKLLEKDKAHQAPAARGESPAIIYQVKAEEIGFDDAVYGPIKVSGSRLKDIVLLKSDGSPAYNFACVVDDHEMGITHVIRGDDHIPNTPKQLVLYQALGWTPPAFAHLPLILGPDKSPLSKRHGATSLRAFRELGILSPALRNYLALLGWSPGDDREILNTGDLIKEFSLPRVTKGGAVFDYEKLLWLNGKYMQQISPESLARMAHPFLEKALGASEKLSRERILKVVKLLGARMKTLRQLVEQGEYFFKSEIYYDPQAVEKYWSRPNSIQLLEKARDALKKVETFTAPELEKILRDLTAELNIKVGDLIHPLRVAVTGRTDSPGIFEVLDILGKETVLMRLNKAIEYLRERQY